MAITAALIGLGGTALATGGGLLASSMSGSGGAQRTDLYDQQLADARQQAIQAQINAAQTGRLGRAGYSDSFGSEYYYDPTTNQWVSKLGDQPARVQTAADIASILRNTTDVRQAQGANARADINAARAQPFIDQARRRLEGFQPMSGDELSSLLGKVASDANTQAYRPIVQDTLRQYTRTGSAAGPVLADIGRRSAADLRQGLIEARIKGLTSAEEINNQKRAGLTSDLQAATTAGTPSFQYPQIVPSTNNRDMLAALSNRASGAAYSSALGQSGVSAANKLQQDATGSLAGSIPLDSVDASRLYSGSQQLANLFKDKNNISAIASLFGGGSNKQQYAADGSKASFDFGE